MSIEKLDFQKATKEQIPYTLISTRVIQNIKDPIAGFVWIYLSSLPHNWLVNKEQIMSKFDIGDKKCRSIFSYLHRSRLVKYIQEREENGKLGEFVIHVLCGDLFDSNEPFTGKAKIASTDNSPVRQKTALAVNRTGGFVGLQKKEYTKPNKELLKKKIKEKREKHPLPPDFFPDQNSLQFLHDKNIYRDMAQSAFEKFKEYYSDGFTLSDDWQKKFRIWVLREKEFIER